MALATLGGYRVLDARITLPQRGVWRIDATIDVQAVLSGRQSFVCGDSTFVGTLESFELYADTGHAILVPGAGASQTVLAPAAWRNTSIATIAQATLREAGETLSSTSSGLSTQWPFFVRLRGNFGACMARLCAVGGLVWRYADDGTVYLGPATTRTPTQPYRVLTRDPRIGQLTIQSDSIFARPGDAIDGKTATAIEHKLAPDGVRSIVTYEVTS